MEIETTSCIYLIGIGRPLFERFIRFGATKIFLTNDPDPECPDCFKWHSSREYFLEESPDDLCKDCLLFKRIIIVRLPRMRFPYFRRYEKWD